MDLAALGVDLGAGEVWVLREWIWMLWQWIWVLWQVGLGAVRVDLDAVGVGPGCSGEGERRGDGTRGMKREEGTATRELRGL